jgi:hypothetical protein
MFRMRIYTSLVGGDQCDVGVCQCLNVTITGILDESLIELCAEIFWGLLDVSVLAV